MISILKANHAKLIGLDLLYSQKEQNPGLNEIKKLHESISEYQKTANDKISHDWILGRLEKIAKEMDNDRELSQAVRASGSTYRSTKAKVFAAIPPRQTIAVRICPAM